MPLMSGLGKEAAGIVMETVQSPDVFLTSVMCDFSLDALFSTQRSSDLAADGSSSLSAAG